MKYCLLFVVQFMDDTKDSVSVYQYTGESEAIASFHKQLGGWINKDNVQHILCDLLTADGGTIRCEVWDR